MSILLEDFSAWFEIQELTEGVYAATARRDQPMNTSNAGIIDLGERTLVFDTFNTPQAGADLRRVSETLTGRKPALVILSHAHGDHRAGNQAFADIPILSTILARERITKERPADGAGMQRQLEEMEARLHKESDPRWIATLETMIMRRRFEMENLPAVRTIPPDQTFEGKMEFHGRERSAVLTSRGHAHSPGDAVLCLPEDSIAFIGDLGFFQEQPYMGDCVPQAWREELHALSDSGYSMFVPGHGGVGNREDLALLDGYIEWLTERTKQACREGLSVEEVIAEGLPEPFDGWLMGGMGRFELNVRTLMKFATPL